MASLKWVVHSACHVLGYPTKEETYNLGHGDMKGLKTPNDNNVVGLSYKAVSLCPSQEAFQMPLHYPRYSKADYENMDEWKLDLLLGQYGLSFNGSLEAKREFAKGTFLWPDQY